MFLVTLVFGVAFCRAGVLRDGGEEAVDACTMCSTEEEGRLFCRGEKMPAFLSVERCPGAQLWTDSDILVTGLRGWVERARLSRTTLGCESFDANQVAILNGKECEPSSNSAAKPMTATTTTTTTTAKPFPWWPVPFGMEEENITTSSTSTSSTSSFLTTANGNTTTTTRDVTTFTIAVTAGVSVNGTLLIITIGLTVTVVGAIISVRCVRKRAGRRRDPIQVPDVTSTTTTALMSTGVRRRSGGSWESIELFKRD